MRHNLEQTRFFRVKGQGDQAELEICRRWQIFSSCKEKDQGLIVLFHNFFPLRINARWFILSKVKRLVKFLIILSNCQLYLGKTHLPMLLYANYPQQTRVVMCTVTYVFSCISTIFVVPSSAQGSQSIHALNRTDHCKPFTLQDRVVVNFLLFERK